MVLYLAFEAERNNLFSASTKTRLNLPKVIAGLPYRPANPLETESMTGRAGVYAFC